MSQQQVMEIDRSTYDNYNKDNLIYKAKPGVTKEIVEEISRQKKEPEWMLKKRLNVAFGVRSGLGSNRDRALRGWPRVEAVRRLEPARSLQLSTRLAGRHGFRVRGPRVFVVSNPLGARCSAALALGLCSRGHSTRRRTRRDSPALGLHRPGRQLVHRRGGELPVGYRGDSTALREAGRRG